MISGVNFQRLTPKSDIELGVYKKALDFVFEHKDLKNIAITGGYGSGKSSILKSYTKKSRKRGFVYVSLAHFKDICSEERPSNKGNNNEKLKGHPWFQTLEGKVINQLVHCTRSQKARKTGFRIKRNMPWCKKVVMTGFVVLGSLSLLCSFRFDSFLSFVEGLDVVDLGGSVTSRFFKQMLSSLLYPLLLIAKLSKWVQLISWIVLLLMFSVLIYLLIGFLVNSEILAKLSFKDKEINIFPADQDSSFDKHLDELLYIIECSGAKVFVFEDIDRFETNEIFIKLREINQLINQRRKCSGSKIFKKNPVRFFYMIRDDLFESGDRVKFFDFIIPVVPIVVVTNSYERFVEMFRAAKVDEDFNDYFLRDICRYIVDMRILKNIFNEYQIYRERLRGNPRIDVNKLLALITLKNMYPQEFAKLQRETGEIFTLFDVKKKELIKEEINRIGERIVEFEGEISTMKETAATREVLGGRPKEVAELTYRKRQVQTRKLHELITESNENETLGAFATRPLIKYLIRSGYLDENYADYMSYFLGLANTRADYLFLRSVTDKEPKEYDYEINNPKQVLKGLNPVYFEQLATLNNDLIDYMLENQGEFQEQLSNIFRQLIKDKNIGFISQYLTVGRQRSSFVKTLNNVWAGVWRMMQRMFGSGEFSSFLLHQYAIDTLLHSPIDDISKLNDDGIFTSYISEKEDFLTIDDLKNDEIELITEKLAKLKVSFVKIDFEVSNKDLFDKIYEADLYAINTSMITLILKEKYEVENLKDFVSKNFTLITSDRGQPLYGHVTRNMDEYVEWLLENSGIKITDSPEVAIELLNHDDLTLENKKAYLGSLETIIEDIGEIMDRDLWPTILEKSIALYTEGNVLKYYFDYAESFDEVLIKFLNDDERRLEFNYGEIKECFGGDNNSKWLVNLICCQDLIDTKWEEILASLSFHYNKFEIKELTDERIGILLQQRKVEMNEHNLEFMRENYQDHVVDYIELNIEKYISDVANEDLLADEELMELLKREIADTHKIALIKLTEMPLSIVGHGCSEAVKLFILENNFDENDLEGLIADFESLSPPMQKVVKDICVERFDFLVDNEVSLPFTLLYDLLARDYDETDKRNLLIHSLRNFDINQGVKLLRLVGLSKLITAFKGKNPRLPRYPEIKIILDICKDKGWIRSISFHLKDVYIANSYRKDPPGAHL